MYGRVYGMALSLGYDVWSVQDLDRWLPPHPGFAPRAPGDSTSADMGQDGNFSCPGPYLTPFRLDESRTGGAGGGEPEHKTRFFHILLGKRIIFVALKDEWVKKYMFFLNFSPSNKLLYDQLVHLYLLPTRPKFYYFNKWDHIVGLLSIELLLRKNWIWIKKKSMWMPFRVFIALLAIQ